MCQLLPIPGGCAHSASPIPQPNCNHPKPQPGDYAGGAVVKNPPANAGDMGSSPGLGSPTCHGATKPLCHNY